MRKTIDTVKSASDNALSKMKKRAELRAFFRRQKRRNRLHFPTVWDIESFAAIDNLGSAEEISEDIKKEVIENLHKGKELHYKQILRSRLLAAPISLFIVFNYFGLSEHISFAGVTLDATSLPSAEIAILLHSIVMFLSHGTLVKYHTIERMLQRAYYKFYENARSQIYIRALVVDTEPIPFWFENLPSRHWGKARNWISKLNLSIIWLRGLTPLLFAFLFYYLAFSKIFSEPNLPTHFLWPLVGICILLLVAVLFRTFVFGLLSPFRDWSKLEELRSLQQSDPVGANKLNSELFDEMNQDINEMRAKGVLPSDETEFNKIWSKMSDRKLF
ncbi:hypothetical protein [Maritalea mediterranea]|uniref:DUF2868 domain-containing protein n=1 Tax=Maritalea mediterranea TaxID=2909667 RepID=A0ABS9E5F9_9HYPH|nr:hypothetical protein [Maritalea mediterranea]MCF4098104.1 hypothetical protein [Maritalea mediterranea]